ncbi:uncharacterized protein LOC144656889 [Oculina patagonica]
MFSRRFISAASLLSGSESRALTASMRSLYAINGRALRPISCVLSRQMSKQEASSGLRENATRTTKPLIPSEVHIETKQRTNRRRSSTFSKVLVLVLSLLELLPALIPLCFYLLCLKLQREQEYDLDTLLALGEALDTINQLNGNRRDKAVAAAAVEDTDSEIE